MSSARGSSGQSRKGGRGVQRRPGRRAGSRRSGQLVAQGGGPPAVEVGGVGEGGGRVAGVAAVDHREARVPALRARDELGVGGVAPLGLAEGLQLGRRRGDQPDDRDPVGVGEVEELLDVDRVRPVAAPARDDQLAARLGGDLAVEAAGRALRWVPPLIPQFRRARRLFRYVGATRPAAPRRSPRGSPSDRGTTGAAGPARSRPGTASPPAWRVSSTASAGRRTSCHWRRTNFGPPASMLGLKSTTTSPVEPRRRAAGGGGSTTPARGPGPWRSCASVAPSRPRSPAPARRS